MTTSRVQRGLRTKEEEREGDNSVTLQIAAVTTGGARTSKKKITV